MSNTFVALALMTLGGLVTTVGLSFADGNRATQSVVGSDLILPYDGYLMIDSAPFTGTRTIKFDLYRASSGGTPVWTEEQPVNIYNGRFSAGLGTSTSLTQTILDAEKLWLAMTVIDTSSGSRVEVPLSGRQAIEPAPFAAWSANSADFQVAGDLQVDQALNVTGASTLTTTNVNGDLNLNGPLKPAYSNWDNTTGAGGAVIRNDNGTFNALMIVGSNAAGAAPNRAVRLFDDVTIEDDLTVKDNMAVLGNLTIGDDNDIYGVDIIQGFNDLRLQAAPSSGITLLLQNNRITASEAVTINSNVDNNGSDAALVINGASNTKMLLDGNEIDGANGLFLQNNTNAGLTVGSNSTINGNLTVNGDITNLQVTTYASTPLPSQTLTNVNNSVCFLTQVRNVTSSSLGNQFSCLIDQLGNDWTLIKQNSGGNVTCRATCLSW